MKSKSDKKKQAMKVMELLVEQEIESFKNDMAQLTQEFFVGRGEKPK